MCAYPSPAFEGAEKRLELHFVPRTASAKPGVGLRAIPKAAWDRALKPAQCCIVSHASNGVCDAYLLSESSLFVFANKVVLKTCGTTKILASVPGIATLAGDLPEPLEVAMAKYSRSSFACPDGQPAPHNDFGGEVACLDALFGHLGNGGHAYVLGDHAHKDALWHVYVAGYHPGTTAGAAAPVASGAAAAAAGAAAAAAAGGLEATSCYALEVCMTGLDPSYCQAHFYQRSCDKNNKGANVTPEAGYEWVERAVCEESGIRDAIGAQDVTDDYLFAPCGYSLNALQGERLCTIHVTPEEDCSYASVEFCGAGNGPLDADAIVAAVAARFRPARMYVAMTVEAKQSAMGHVCSPLIKREGKREGKKGRESKAQAACVRYEETCACMQTLATGQSVHFFAMQACGAPAKDPHTRLHPDSRKMPSPCTVLDDEDVGMESVTAGSDSGSSDLNYPHLTHSPCACSDGTASEGEGKGELSLSRDFSPDFSDESSSDDAITALDQIEYLDPFVGTILAKAQGTSDFKSKAYEGLQIIDGTDDVSCFASDRIRTMALEDTFFVVDIGNVFRRMKTWKRLLPRVRPFYAVKCNPDPVILATLATLGCGFDCASERELESVLALGVDARKDVVYANACKRPADLKHMSRHATQLTTFDSEHELFKIANHHPRAQCLLRIRADDPNARCYLGNKYGAERDEIEALIACTQELGLDLVGVSFHVGSGASDPRAFENAIGKAREVFDVAHALGLRAMRVLDIGGGFSGGSGDGLDALFTVSGVINASLERNFPDDCGYRIIAEPGRYFAEAACTLYTCVYGKRARVVDGNARKEYWLTDGLYGSMNCVIYDHAQLTAIPLCMAKCTAQTGSVGERMGGEGDGGGDYVSTLFGPTCDGLDTVLKDVMLPDLQLGDWVAFPEMGAYTLSASSNFNGIQATEPAVFYVMSKQE